MALVDDALNYAKRGWFVFPCREKHMGFYVNKKGQKVELKEKTPYTINGVYDATTDPNKIKRMWKKTPNAMIGVSCLASGLFVVDIDAHTDNVDGFSNWMSLNISDAGALHSMTPNGGYHIIYSGHGRNSTKPWLGVDTRGDGGLFIAPPSRLYDKDENYIGTYIAVDNWNKEPAPIPIDLFEKLELNRKKNNSKYDDLDFELTDENIKRVERALNKINTYDSYNDWVSIGLACKSIDDGIIGFKLWNDWSKKSSKYNEEEMEYKWDSFKPQEITVGTIFHLAKES